MDQKAGGGHVTRWWGVGKETGRHLRCDQVGSRWQDAQGKSKLPNRKSQVTTRPYFLFLFNLQYTVN